jgi:hypothetical protein
MVVADPTITTQPVGGTICTGGSINLSVVATGGTPLLTYQWYNTAGAIGGATSSSYAPTATSNYYCIVSASGNDCGSATSSIVLVTIVVDPNAPTATESPNDATVCEGQTLTLTDVTDNGGGTGTCNIEYCYSINSGSTYSSWSTSLPSFVATGSDNRIKIRKVCDGSGCNISSETTYTWAVDPTSVGGTAIATPSSICAGETVELSISGNTGSIQWQTNASGSWVDISGVTSSNYTTLAIPMTTSYQAVVTSGVCSISANSNVVTVTVVTPITTGLIGNDYIWTGATDQTWDGITTNNWLKFISTTVFEIPLDVPDVDDNVFIRTNGSCFNSSPVVTTYNVAECHNLTIDSDCSLFINTSGNLKINGDLLNLGNLTVTAAAPIEIKGNWTNSGVFDCGLGLIKFSGVLVQSIFTNNDSFYDVEFDNTNEDNYDISLTDNLTVSHSAKFINGIVNTGSNTFTFTSAATTTEGTITSFVDGLVEKLGCVKFTFPTGNVNIDRYDASGSQYYRIWAPIITTVFSPPADVNVKYLFSNENLHQWWYTEWTHEDPLTHTSNREYWLVNSSSDLEVTLFWNNNNPCLIHDFCAPDPTDFMGSDLTIAYWDGIWKDARGTASASYISGEITSEIYIPFGAKGERQITFGAKNTELPLPIELTYFRAVCEGKNAIIEWETASETNNDYFVLEKSNGESEFYEIARLQGAGNSNEILNYLFIDVNLFDGDNYYRLKQFDLDSKMTIHNVIILNCDENTSGQPNMYAFPNPFTNELNVVIENFETEAFVLEIFDDLGRVVYYKKFESQSSEFKTTIDLQELRPAVYNLRSKSDSNVLNVRVVKK